MLPHRSNVMKSLLVVLAAALVLCSCGPNAYTRSFVEASAALARPPAKVAELVHLDDARRARRKDD